MNHSFLLDKLPAYGIKNNEAKWIVSFLFGRAQVVNFEGTLTENNFITHRSILGPLLFALFINDIHTELKECKILLYADDTVTYFSHKNISYGESILNEEANRIARWMSENHLTLNLKKENTEFILFATSRKLSKETATVTINIHGERVNETTQYKYLGVILDHQFNLHEQVTTVYNKASSRLKFLKRVRNNLTSYVAEFNQSSHIARWYIWDSLHI